MVRIRDQHEAVRETMYWNVIISRNFCRLCTISDSSTHQWAGARALTWTDFRPTGKLCKAWRVTISIFKCELISVSLFHFVLTLTFGPTSIFFYINTFEVSDLSDLAPLQSSHAGSSENIYYDKIFPRLKPLEPNKLFQEGILKTGAKTKRSRQRLLQV